MLLQHIQSSLDGMGCFKCNDIITSCLYYSEKIVSRASGAVSIMGHDEGDYIRCVDCHWTIQ